MGMRKRAEDDDVVRITAAPQNVGADVDRRQRRYLISMTIRTLCFVAAVLCYRIPWLCALLIAASFLLPFIAVVVANAAAPRVAEDLEGPGVWQGPDHREIGHRTSPFDAKP